VNRFVKCTAGILGAAIMMSLSSCGDTGWTYRAGNSEITSGMYIGLSIDALQSAYSAEGVESSSSVFKQQVEGQNGLDWVVSKTAGLAREYLAIEEKFNELGLSFTAEEQASIDSYVEAYWGYLSSMYEDKGCGQASFKKLLTNTEKRQKIFEALYNEGGERAVDEAELKAVYEKDYVKAVYISVPLIDDNRQALEGEELEKQKKAAEDLLKEIQDGKDIEQVKADFESSEGSGTAADTAEYIYREGGYPEALTKALFDAKDGDSGKTESGSYLYVWQKLKLDDAGFDQVKGTILSREKNEEYAELVTQWGSELAVTENQAGIRKHSPKNLE
jgi:hypothetical protein